MKDINILNSKDRKVILKQLTEQFGVEKLPDLVYFSHTNPERVYVLERSIFDNNIDLLRINSMGLHFGTRMVDGFRPSLEGLDILREELQHHILDVTVEERKAWVEGEDLTSSNPEHDRFYLVIRYKDEHSEELLGVGKVKDGKILNYMPKSRKIKEAFTT